MALVTCAECGASISTTAKSCPQCGAKQKKRHTKGQWVFLGLVTVGIVSCIAKGQADGEKRTAAAAAVEAAKTPEKKAAEEKQKAKDSAQLNVALEIARRLKASTKDPSSFKLESLLLYPDGSACYEYRAKNSFAAIVPAQAVWDAPKKKAYGSEQDKSAFAKAWNTICTKPGREIAGGVLGLPGL
jgi:RNA polymerase subunit RPABC4/transcription elongation factor Spt4